ncbi:Hpt domain-containing protein [Rheinheimera sp.]|uniref:Hpt domain-containing protein n=1 Tax=Rheinheimera sp. TaxID=1869214 RepID=UPI0027361DC6|nr:Hpt domain-containing protein [Rheinheimera sp.]MDP2715761.1 Hpt domain-containing protein [Rheinheimera sp.]
MTDAAVLPVLDLNVLIAMYGDDSADTITLALSGFRREATKYVQKLQSAAQQDATADIARVCHSLKSMCGLVGATRLMQLCLTLEQAARQQDLAVLQAQLPALAGVWLTLLAELNRTLLQHGYIDV